MQFACKTACSDNCVPASSIVNLRFHPLGRLNIPGAAKGVNFNFHVAHGRSLTHELFTTIVMLMRKKREPKTTTF